MAQSDGIFHKNGLSTTLQYVSSPANMASLIGGKLQIDDAGADTVFAAMKGAPVELVAEESPHFGFYLMSQSGVHSVADLVGKSVAVTAPSVTTAFALSALLQRAHIPQASVLRAYGHTVTGVVALLKGHRVAAAIVPVPFNIVLAKEGFRTLVNMISLRIPIPQTGVSVRRDWAKAHKAVLERFLRAYAEAVKICTTDKAAVYAAVEKYVHVSAKPLLAAEWQYARVALNKGLLVSNASIKAAMQFGPKGAIVTNPRDMYDNSYVMDLHRQGYFKALYPGSSSG